ncbi:MAG: cbb3-type cytochrome oxidase assembly protein CcoS [Neisseria sp.]|nr:cbb3-type cytochrome oxidase assembly protein CcoS [Neisseria sp.]
MESVYILIPLSILLVFVIGAAFWWSSKSGQFDDLDGPGYRVIMDDDSTDTLPENNDDNPPTS